MNRTCLELLIAYCCLLASGCAETSKSSVPHREEIPPPDYLLHLPGIAGEQNLDRQFIAGLREGGYTGKTEIYDWTENDPGIRALHSRSRNDKEADAVGRKLETILSDNPRTRIRLVCHSGGAGIAAWALEKLPPELQVETLVFIAPALSQKYDLSKALAHVRTKAYAFTSENDVIILGAGTRLFGTIDGLKEEAAGLRGFTEPAGADKAQYAKLVQMPYRDEWMKLDNLGEHIGAMGRTFARAIISPLVQGKDPPARFVAPTSKPSEAEGGRGDGAVQERRPQHAGRRQ
jgi:pimeloyl-ACP methyl ester carboxylesterase